jgi:hypothetical protein
MLRQSCPDCNNLSLVSLDGVTLCINRNCSSNLGRVETCPSCQTPSLIIDPAWKMCVKSSCPDLFRIQHLSAVKSPGDDDPWGLSSPTERTAIPFLADTPEPPATPVQPPEPPATPVPTPAPAATPLPAAVPAATLVPVSVPMVGQPLPSVPDPPTVPVAPALPVQTQSDPPQIQAEAVAPPARDPVQDPAETVAVAASRWQDAPSEIERAFAFLRQHIIAGSDGTPAPIMLVFGLAGSGKSTYLTMLGEILAQGGAKYHFPHDGVAVRSLRLDRIIERVEPGMTDVDRSLLQRRIRDLTFDYAGSAYTRHLANGCWCPATVRESGAAGAAHSFFLVSEIVRRDASIGRIVTIETSGEDFQEILAGIGRIRDHRTLASPLQRVLFELLDLARGVILLLDPDGDNDTAYAPLLRLIREEIEDRAAAALVQRIDRRLEQELASAALAGDAGLDSVLDHERRAEDRERRRTLEAARLATDLARLHQRLPAVPRHHAGVAALVADERRTLDEIDLLIGRVDQEYASRSQALFATHGRTAANFLSHYAGALAVLRAEDRFAAAVDLLLDLADGRARDRQAVIDRIREDLGIIAPVHEALISRWDGQPAGTRFRELRHLALVVTKSDRHPIIHPPADYPRLRLPTCHAQVTALDASLRLLGGALRCYNATAIGYAVQRGASWQPGPGNSFTPVNIAEPVFDMLLLDADRP